MTMTHPGAQPVIRKLLLAAILLAASAGVGCEGVAGPIEPTPLAAANFGSVRFQAILCEVSLPAEGAADIDAERLAAAPGDVKGFMAKLSALGASRILYQLDETVDLHAPSRIRAGSRVPFVTASRVTESGRTVNAVQYMAVGADCRIAGRPVKDTDPPCMQVEVKVELSTVSESGVSVSEKVKGVATHQATLLHAGPVALGRPFVMVTMGPAAKGKGKDAEAIAFVCRAVFTRRNIVHRPAARTRPSAEE